VILGHITFSLMYVAVVVGASLRLVRTDLEEAARDLGATAPETLRLIVLPQVLPAVAGAAMLVFVISFDDFVTSVFLSGSEVAPLPVRIYGMLRYGLTPEVNALGTSMMLASVVIGLAGIWIVNRRTSTRQSTALA
jgi:ABC-type spermidine/putrescine transport system permease subunit II